MVFEVDTASHGVDDRLWLLEYLLLHEVAVVALHDLLQFHLHRGYLAGVGVVQRFSQSVNGENAAFYGRDVVVL